MSSSSLLMGACLRKSTWSINLLKFTLFEGTSVSELEEGLVVFRTDFTFGVEAGYVVTDSVTKAWTSYSSGLFS